LQPQQAGGGVVELQDRRQSGGDGQHGYPSGVPTDAVGLEPGEVDDADVQVGEAEQEDARGAEHRVEVGGGGDQVEGDGGLQRSDEQVEDRDALGVNLAEEQ
jgi:hypothetical protein